MCCFLREKRTSRGKLIKYLAVMKLTIILLIATLQVSASVYSQQISLHFNNASLQQVLSSIRKQSNYTFGISSSDLEKAKPVTLTIKSKNIEEILQAVFADQPFVYQVQNNIIMIKLRETEKKSTAPVLVELTNIKGTVTDKDGQPLVGATVIVVGQNNKGATTNEKGEFYLPNVPESGKLLVRMIGYGTEEVSYSGGGILKIRLSAVKSELDEVQVIAYGTQLKKYSTSSIGTVSAEEIQRQPVSNPILALAGRVPGLFIKQGSGVTAGPVTVTIQGTNSLQNSNDPFYVVDGVPFSSTFTSQSLSNSASGGFGGNPFNFINPSDIESISILKDADATAIYGSRAANGAILITTKKGISGKTIMNFNLQNGWGKITRKGDLVNTQQYLQVRKERYINDGNPVPTIGTPPAGSNYDLTFWDQNKYTDWQTELIGGTAKFTDLQGSVSGGTDNTQFLCNYGYHNETTVYPTDFYDKKGNIRLNLNHRSADSRFKFVLTGAYLQGKNTLGGLDLASRVNQLAPNAPDLRLANGSLNWAYLPNGTTSTLSNPLQYLQQRYTGKTYNLIADNTISYEIVRGLNIKATMGYNRLDADETLFTPLSFYGPALPSAIKVRFASYLNKAISTWIVEPQLTYMRATKLGFFDVLVGTTFQESRTNMIRQSGSGYAADVQLPDITAATTKTVDLVEYDQYKYTAAFGRLNYRLSDKYIINLNLRRDGSSRFGPESRFHTFYAVGVAWLFNDEAFIKQTVPWLSFGKLRGSYGTTGNDQIGNYRFLNLLDIYPGAQIPYQDGLSLQVSKIDNPHLHWEETRKLNFGLDFGIINNRIMVNLTYARNRSSNQLISDNLPRITGASGVDANLPALVQNISYEVQLSVVPIKTPKFTWQVSGNITVPKNKLVDFPNFESSGYQNTYVIGQPLSIKRVYPFAGVNPESGLYQYRNAKGELTSAPSSTLDRTLRINVDPKYYGGISNSFTYKGFQLDFLFQFVKQIGVIQKYTNVTGAINAVPLNSVRDRWQKPGDIASIQKAGSTPEVFTAARPIGNSEAGFGDVSFVRLKNAALSYTIPQSIVSRSKMSNVRIYIQGQNLLTITDFYGSDPETLAGALPPLKMITAGIQLIL
jgi:TonB-linked SusC/RagA family outer membrane protein